jgi:choline dehydrogenase-like flavoprotein
MSDASPGSALTSPRTHGIDALDASEPYDVCIIGSGFAGTVVAQGLARRGVRVLMLESGESLARWFLDPRMKELAAYEVSGDCNYPTTRTKARALGGNSNFWTGRVDRYHPTDFEKHPYTPPENPWPIGYAELEPFYLRAEQTLRTRGGAPSQHLGPRSGPLPLPPSTDISSLRAILEPAGVVLDDSPTATPRHAFRFFRLHREVIPELLALPSIRLVRGATVTRLQLDANRTVVGAEVRTLDGAKKQARARIFVVACGGIETPRLLLLSRCEAAPEGIGNRYDRVGRGFNEHPGVNMYAKIHHSRHTLLPRHKIGRSHQYYDDFRAEGLGSVLPVFIQSWVFPHHLIQPRLGDAPKQIAGLAARLFRPTLYIGATIEQNPHDDNRVTLSRRSVDRFGDPLAHLHFSFTPEDRATLERTRALIRGLFDRVGADSVEEVEVTWSRHHIGTCRMGTNPATSVTDPDLRVHDCQNLYLSGCQIFVTGAAVPPVATITAFAHRLSDHLAQRLLGR